MITTTNFFLDIHYDYIEKKYFHIITLNKKPIGPLSKYIRSIALTNASSKIDKSQENYCSYAIDSNILDNKENNKLNICTLESITIIYDFLINNNYIINNDLTNIFNNNNNNNNNIISGNKRYLFTFNYKN
jgi:hypothetical protein